MHPTAITQLTDDSQEVFAIIQDGELTDIPRSDDYFDSVEIEPQPELSGNNGMVWS